jgi:kinesin family protein 18/19
MIRKVVKVLDDRVCVFDPPETSPIASYQKTLLGPSVKKVKDIRFCFDKVFDETAGQEDVFEGCAKELVPGVLDGFNATVFAYGVSSMRHACDRDHNTYAATLLAPGYRMRQDTHHLWLAHAAWNRLSTHEGSVRPDICKAR